MFDDLDDERKHIAKVITYVGGAIYDCIKEGYLSGDSVYEVTPKGLADYDQIKASGFKPDDYDLACGLMSLQGDDVDESILVLLMDFRDGLLKTKSPLEP